MEQLNLMRSQKEIWRGSKKEMEGKKEGESQRRGGREGGMKGKEHVCLK